MSRRPEDEQWLDERLGEVSPAVRDLVATAVLDGPFGLVHSSEWRIHLRAHPESGVAIEQVIWLRNTRHGTRGFASIETWANVRINSSCRVADARSFIETDVRP